MHNHGCVLSAAGEQVVGATSAAEGILANSPTVPPLATLCMGKFAALPLSFMQHNTNYCAAQHKRTGQEKERNMSLIRRIGTLRTLSFAVGVTLGLVSAVYAQSGTDAQLPARPPGPQVALGQWPIVAGYQRQPTVEEVDRRRDERGIATSTSRLRHEDREMQQLYDEILRQTEPALRP